MANLVLFTISYRIYIIKIVNTIETPDLGVRLSNTAWGDGKVKNQKGVVGGRALPF